MSAQPHIGDLVQPRCWLALKAAVTTSDEPHVCSGKVEWHHVVTKNLIKRRFKWGAWRRFGSDEPWTPGRRGVFPSGHIEYRSLDDILVDPRNRVWLCSEGAHEPVTNARLRLRVPASVWMFAADFGFTAALENDLAKQTPDPSKCFPEDLPR